MPFLHAPAMHHSDLLRTQAVLLLRHSLHEQFSVQIKENREVTICGLNSVTLLENSFPTAIFFYEQPNLRHYTKYILKSSGDKIQKTSNFKYIN